MISYKFELTLVPYCYTAMSIITENKLPVSFTASAVEEIHHLFSKGNYGPGYGLRSGVKGGGCAGFSYVLDFDTMKENDSSFTLEGIPLYIDKSQAIYLHDCAIDFKSGLDNRGFIFNNPNATETCGCGTSFSA